jgi:hypothetical protein
LRSKDAPAVLALVFICLLPGLHAVGSGGPLILPTEPVASRALEQISASVREAANRGEVLFMDQRQLLTFGQVAQVPLVLDYELKHVMNQAMADNEAYFERFEADLAAGRFSLIVSDSLEIVYQGRTHAFGEENDAWVEHVTLPLLAYYEPVAEFKPLDVWLMAPRSEP